MWRRTIYFLLTVVFPFQLAANEVTLSTPNGEFAVQGRLLEFDGEFFRIETDQGAVTLDSGAVRCTGEGCPPQDALIAQAKIGGPESMINTLLPSLLLAFAAENGLTFQKTQAKTGTVWEIFDADQQIGVISTEILSDRDAKDRLKAREIDVALGMTATGPPFRQDVIALDALVPVVAPDNPRVSVTVGQIAGLLNGDISNWSRLGGSDAPVQLHLYDGWEQSKASVYGAGAIRDAVLHDDPAQLVKAVASDQSALGLVPYSSIGNTVPLVVSGACGLATPATRESIRSEDYAMTQPLFLHRIGARQPKIIRDLIAFIRSPEAQPAVRDAGFVDQALGRIGFQNQSDRISNAFLAPDSDLDQRAVVQDAIGQLMNSERLTLTFRFRDGSSQLDPQSASNLRRLADAIDRGDFEGQEVLFVGFSDGIGPADDNLRLSRQRAASVKKEVASRVIGDAVQMSVLAFGEALPIACDTAPWGRQVNRRVELWLR